MSATTTSLTRQTRTASRTSSASVAVCTWEGHCLGDSCSSEDDCDRDWVCASKTCQTCCVTDSEPTFFSTFSTSGPTTSSSDWVIFSSATPSQTSSPTSTASSGGLGTGAAVGIGIGGAALLIICMVGGWWAFMRRRKKHEAYELGAVAPLSYDDDRKELYHATGHTQELETRHPPAELHAVELVELRGSDIGRQRDEGKTAT